MSKVVEIGKRGANMTPAEVLAVASRQDWQDVLILGFDEEGQAVLYSSPIHVGELIALVEAAKASTIEQLFD